MANNLYYYADGQPHSYEEIIHACDNVAELEGDETSPFKTFLAINTNFIIKFKQIADDQWVSVARYGRLFEDAR